VLLPEAVAATTPERRRSYLRSYVPGAALLGAALLAPTWLGGRLAAHLFPAAMPDAVRVFQLLATAQIALLVANPVQFLLYGAGRPQWCTASDALITLLFAAMAVWLAPAHGAVGVGGGRWLAWQCTSLTDRRPGQTPTCSSPCCCFPLASTAGECAGRTTG
jgi:O-antigen/teichoic acid export membrane protein